MTNSSKLRKRIRENESFTEKMLVSNNSSIQWFGDTSTGALHFLASKTRVAPVCGQIIPKLEILAALLLAKLLDRQTFYKVELCQQDNKACTC